MVRPLRLLILIALCKCLIGIGICSSFPERARAHVTALHLFRP